MMILAATVVFALCDVAARSTQSHADAAAPGDVTCRQNITVSVALTDTEPKDYTIVGELCATQDELIAGQTIQLLLNGDTYSHIYWGFPPVASAPTPTYYSYAKNLAANGYPSFVIDRLGSGASSRPLSTDVTLQADASTVHQVIQGLHNGSITGTPFGKVTLVGSALGSVTAWEEAITYHDIDGLIITGLLHHVSPTLAAAVATDLYPANLDPKFADSGLDSGYQTTRPGTRAALFYGQGDADQNVINEDEATKDIVALGELNEALPVIPSPLSQQINVPVEIIVGSQDGFFCDATGPCASSTSVLNEESPYYSSQACLQADLVPSAGHAVALASNNSVENNDTITWLNSHIGTTTSFSPPSGCGTQ